MPQNEFKRKFPHLSSPLKIGNVTLRNRMMSAPMSFPDITQDGFIAASSAAYYELRAKGGAAGVTISECVVHPQTGKSHKVHIDIAAPNAMRSFAVAANSIRRHGAVASLQLSHGGMYGGVDSVDKSSLVGSNRFGPSKLTLSNGTLVEEMPVELIHEITRSFAHYAALAKQAGFNMLMVHAGHGWLLHQFLSPLYNFRSDEYGGSTQKRARFLIEVLDSVREAVGADFPIELRMSGADFAEGGYDVNEAIEIAKLIESKVQLLHVSAGIFEGGFSIQHPSMFHDRGCNVWLAAEIKKHVSVPVATVGGLNDPAMMEEIIASGKADVVEMARALLADPYLPSKVMEGRDDEIVGCFRCFTCHAERMTNGLRRCAANPIIGWELENRHVPPAAKPKKVIVVGGGVAGLMAALTCAQRGHSVSLYEKEADLGGALRAEKNVSFKRDLYALPAKYALLAEKSGAQINLGTELTPSMAAKMQADALICAIGAEAILPPIPGIQGKNVIMASDLTREDIKTGENVLMLGGGLVGCEMGLHLAMQGKKVTIAELMPSLASDANPRHRPILLDQLERHGVVCLTKTRGTRVTEEGLYCEDESGAQRLIPADSIVCAVGMSAKRDEVNAFRDCAPIFMDIGDCSSPANVLAATSRGYYAALDL